MNSAVIALWKREILRFGRQRSRWIGTLATPLLLWALLGGGLGTSFRDTALGKSGTGYLEFFFPGSVLLSVLFTAIFSTMSVIEDRHQGFLQGVLVAPVPRVHFVLAKVLAGMSLSVLQAALLLLVGWVSGLSFGLLDALLAIPLAALMGGALTALGFYFAWKIDSVAGYHGIMNTVLMPLWILSGAVFPSGGAWRVYRWAQAVNPLSYGLEAFRSVLAGHGWGLNVWGAALLLALVGLVLSLVGAHTMNRPVS